MTDLTLNGFRGLSDKELAKALEIEGLHISGSVVLENDHKKKDIDIYCFPFLGRFWFRFTRRIQSGWKWPVRRSLCDNK